MRRFLCLFLCCILLLCGCQRILTQDTDPIDFSFFYWNSVVGTPGSIKLSGATLSYDGNRYTLTTPQGSHSYSFLIHTSHQIGNAYEDRFFLSNEENATDGETVYTYTAELSVAEQYGQPPEALATFQKLCRRGMIFGKDSFFIENYDPLSESYSSPHLLQQYTWDGQHLCDVTVEGLLGDLCALEDGGFVFFRSSDSDRFYHLTCCTEEGAVAWEYTFEPTAKPSVCSILQRDREIFVFGYYTQNSPSNIFICRLSLEGQLLQEKVFSGSDFEMVSWIESTPDGYLLHGSSQSSDGDFPLSKDGYPVYFRALISQELQILDVQTEEVNYSRQRGWLDGQPIHGNHPVFSISKKDRLPENSYVVGIFNWEDGYVIVRGHNMGNWPFQPTYVSVVHRYTQHIFTGYAADGTPLWQAAGPIFM